MNPKTAFVTLALSVCACTATAGIRDMYVQAVDIDNLVLPVDNTWNGSYGSRETAGPGKDFGFLTKDSGDLEDSLWVHETWTQAHKPSAILGVNLFNLGRSDPVITISKTVDNFTGAAWTGFDITLSTASGNIALIGAPSSTFYPHSSVLHNNSSAVTMSFDSAVVNPGQSVTFDFTFSVPFSGLWSFTITQTPVPAPASLALGFGAVLTLCRRRAAR